MNASGLRMGNWVRHRGTNGKVQATYFEGVELSDRYGLNEWNPVMAEVEPIPLTEEILLKCGFETEDDQFTGIELPYYSLPGTPYFFHKRDLNELLHDEFGRFSIKVQNLHSLQNVIFALTGEELNIEQ